MAKLITDKGRKAIKKMAEISQCARALALMPTAGDFAMMLIGDLRKISQTINNVSARLNAMIEKYNNIPTEFFLKGFDEVLDKLDDISDYAKFTINETLDMVSDTVNTASSITNIVGDTASIITSTVIQVGGGLTYGTSAIIDSVTSYDRVKTTEEIVQDVVDGKISIEQMKEEIVTRTQTENTEALNNYRDAIDDVSTKSVNAIDNVTGNVNSAIGDAINKIDNAKNAAMAWVDGENGIGYLKEKVENAKAKVEEKIERVRKIFDNLTKNFDEAFGFLNGKNSTEESFRNMANTAFENMDSPMFDAVGEATDAVANFIKNFNIGKVVTAIGGMYVTAGAATLAMDVLPNIDIERMLREIVSGADSTRVDKMVELYNNKYDVDGPDLLEVPDVPWRLSKDDIEKHDSTAYKEFLAKYEEEFDKAREDLLKRGGISVCEHLNRMYEREINSRLNRQTVADNRVETPEESSVTEEVGGGGGGLSGHTMETLGYISSINRVEMKQYKSALKDMRKIRRQVIAAKQFEKFKDMLYIEIEYLTRELKGLGDNLKHEWDFMMAQYKTSVSEIKRFFSEEGYGGNATIDRCCDRINDDATQIVELCKSIGVELTNAVAMVPTPYAIGTCVDMPVHKVLAFFKDVKIIITFLKNLIRLGIDILSQLSILAKIICTELQSISEIINTLKEIIGVDSILNMIDYIVSLFKVKMADAKILLENSLSPVYYNETEEYEMRLEALEGLLSDGKGEGYVDAFLYSNDKTYGCKKNEEQVTYGGGVIKDEDIDDIIDALEEKGDREIVAYRSPILNAEGDDFAGWRYFHAYAYDNMNTGWSARKKRRKNKLISKASKKNRLIQGKLIGGVAKLKKSLAFGYTNDAGVYIGNSVSGYDAYYWYTKWTNDPTDCTPDLSNVEYEYDKEGNIISTKAINTDVVNPVQTTQNGSLVELSDGRRVFVEGKIVKSGDFVNVDGKRYRVN